MKWYYIAIPAGLILGYLVLSPKSTLLKGKSASNTSGTGGILTGAGNAATGLSNLWDSVASTFTGSSDTSSSGEE